MLNLKIGDPILVKDHRRDLKDSVGWRTEVFNGIEKGHIRTSMKLYYYCTPFWKFNPRDMAETSKYIYGVKNGKLVNVFPK